MASKNQHTGDKQQTKPASNTYRDNYDRIFGKQPTRDKCAKLTSEYPCRNSPCSCDQVKQVK